MSVVRQRMRLNKIMDCLPPEDADLIAKQLRPVSLQAGETLYGPAEVPSQVFFPLNSIISTSVLMSAGTTVEVLMTGCEGLTGGEAIFSEPSALNWACVLMTGDALSMSLDGLKALFQQNATIRKEVLGSYSRNMIQVSQRATCCSRHTIRQRLCCWLLMIHDRSQRKDLPLTHEVIARQLGTRRAGITQAIGALQSKGAISCDRGQVRIEDRRALEAAACECYRTYKWEFEWLDTRRNETAIAPLMLTGPAR